MNLNEIIRDIIPSYLEIILTWPVAIIIVSMVFLLKFSEEIRNFIQNVSSVRWGSFEALQQKQMPTKDVEEQVEQVQGVSLTQEQWSEISNLVNEKEATIKDLQDALKIMIDRSENFEFAYLNSVLVHNTKLALYWFTLQSQKSSTKENFLNIFPLPEQIDNQPMEKEAIFNALITNGLLKQNGIVYEVTDKGEKFLVHINFGRR